MNPHPAQADSRAVYAFERGVAGDWETTAKLIPADGEVAEQFGRTLEFMDETAVISAIGSSDIGARSGAVDLFERQPDASWEQTTKLLQLHSLRVPQRLVRPQPAGDLVAAPGHRDPAHPAGPPAAERPSRTPALGPEAGSHARRGLQPGPGRVPVQTTVPARVDERDTAGVTPPTYRLSRFRAWPKTEL